MASGGVIDSGPVTRIAHGDTEGRFRVRLRYASGHRLTVNIFLDISQGYPVWLHYNVHLQDGFGRCVFRYDNAAHYPEMATFPDHKHVGPDEVAVAHHRPSLRHVLAEVGQRISGRAGQPE